MRANEAQLADLTARLEALELEKCRLESRARLLEQVVSLNLTHEARLHTNKVRGDPGERWGTGHNRDVYGLDTERERRTSTCDVMTLAGVVIDNNSSRSSRRRKSPVLANRPLNNPTWYQGACQQRFPSV